MRALWLQRLERVEPWLAMALVGACFLGMAPVNIGLGLAAASLLARFGLGQRLLLRGAPWWLWGVLALIAGRLLAAALSPEPLLGFRQLAKDWRFVALVWGATGILGRDPRALRLLVGIMAVTLVWSLAELVGLRGPTPESLRSAGFVGMPLTLAGASLSILFLPGMLPVSRRLALGAWVLAAGLLVVSGTRGAWLGAIVGLFVWAVLSRRTRWRAALGGLVVAAAAALAPGSRTRIAALQAGYNAGEGSVGRRVDLWRSAWEMGRDHPFGVGPGRFPQAVRPYIGDGPGSTIHAHNVPLHLWAEAGVAGLFGVLAFYFGLLASLWGRGRERAGVGVGLVAALFVAGLTEYNLYDGEVAAAFFLVAGHALHRAGSGLRWAEPGADPAGREDTAT